jgi:tellurite resistance protein TerC
MSDLLLLASTDVAAKTWFYAGFVVMILFFLALDLGVFNRTSHETTLREALTWTGVWVTTALCFGAGVYFIYEHKWLGIGLDVAQGAGQAARHVGGGEAAGLYLTAWMLEYALSMDNIFVIALIFRYFMVPAIHQHRVLFWGILGALVLRGVMIWVGAELIHAFHWIEYVFGAFLVFTGLKMLKAGDAEIDPERNPLVRLARKLVRVSPAFDGDRFITKVGGMRAVTPLFLVLLVVETTDVVFAVDSIPAVFGVTRDPFLVFTSNIFAILGLRSLYFALAAIMGRFEHLKYALCLILVFIGAKMLATMWGVSMSPTVSLAIVASTLVMGVVSSLLFGKPREADAT